MLLCERCWHPIDRSTEPLRLTSHTVADGRAHSAVHALPCMALDVGDWDGSRIGAAPAALRWAHGQADHR